LGKEQFHKFQDARYAYFDIFRYCPRIASATVLVISKKKKEKEKDVQEHQQLLLTGTDRQLHELVSVVAGDLSARERAPERCRGRTHLPGGILSAGDVALGRSARALAVVR
jgi:hypothetical protein